MRTLDSNLETALANQQGELILRVNTWTDAADYIANPSTPDHVWTVKAFSIESTTASAELVTENDYTLSAFTVFTIERGVRLSGVDYTIESGLMHVRKYTEDYGAIKITGSSYPNQKINIAAGDGTYQEVIEAFCTAIGKTAVFKNSTDTWLAYQFLPTGKALSLNKAELFENLLKQKYTILVYEESPNNLVFYNQDSYQSSALNALAENAGTLLAIATAGSNGGMTSITGADWIPQILPSFYNDATYAAGLYVAVGASVCATSTDGITWTARTIPAGTYTSLTYGNSLYVAVGTNVCATSADGITWTARTISAGTHKSVLWNASLNLFIVTGTKILTSTDGTTWLDNQNILDAWTARTPAANYYAGLAWSPSLGLFVATDATNGNSVSSPDGITWANRTTTSARLLSVAWSPELAIFAAVGFQPSAFTNNGASSTNGTSWTNRTVVADIEWYYGVAWSSSLGLFAAVGLSGVCATSTNGTSWTTRTAAEAITYTAVAWSPELAIFAAVSNAKAMTSTNGTSWTARTMPAGDYKSVAWSPPLGLFVAVGTNVCATSADGTTWTARTITANAWTAVAWSPKTSSFMAVSSAGTATSTNGTSWTDKASAEANYWRCVAWSEELELFVAMSSDGTNRAMTCPVLPYNLNAITQSSSLFVMVGASTCYTSTNGTTWTSRTIPADTYYGVTYGNSLYVAVGASVVATSTDGTTWTARTPAALNTWRDVIYSSTLALFIAVASDGVSRTMTSADGITWTASTARADFELSYLDGPKSYLDRQQSAVHFIWRDEAATVHTSGDTDNPQWNLGFLASTDSPPTTKADAYYKIFLQKAPVRLDITDGDNIHFTPYWSIDPTQTIDAMMQISEHLNLRASPAWYQEIRSIVLFDKTEGGALPSTIERVAAYTPLVSTGFDGNLTPAVNNLQALAQAVDDMTLGAAPATTAANDFQVGNGSGNWITKTLAQTITILRTSLDSIFVSLTSGNAEIASGKTYNVNGSPHVHTAAVVAAIPNDGWVAISATGTSGTLDAPSFEISFNADMTGLIGLGDRIKITQTTTKYFIVTKVGAYTAGATIITCYGGTDYTLIATATTAITNPYFSHVKAPFGFPVSPSKWTVISTDTTTRTKTTPTDNTWYGETNAFDSGGLPNIDIPIGGWNVSYSALVRGQVAAAENFVRTECTLSTSGNSASDTDFTSANSLNAGGDTTGALVTLVNLRNYPKELLLTTKTTYYLLAKLDTATTPTSIQIQGAISTTNIKAVCVYL